jgi:aspartyl/asparaginyl beta-hydroxylase (cupin superfamily)
MSDIHSEVEKHGRRAIAALRSGDVAGARAAFSDAVAADARNLDAWLGLAFACAKLGDDTATLAAVDRALQIDPRHLRALVFKADHLVSTARHGPAVAFYRAALHVAGDTPQPPDVAAALERARGVVDRNTAAVQQRLLNGLTASGHDPATASPRFAASVEISLGRRQVFHQGPTRYYFPGLPQRQFFAREEFGWASGVESATAGITQELEALLAQGGHFTPYLQASTNQPAMNERSLLDSPDWSACYLIHNGAVTAVGARCPQTLAALEAAPVPRIPERSPNVLFSRLAPHTRIPPHNGFLNTRLICHLPLIVPQDCGKLRCGSEAHAWEKGRLMIFDDSIEHEAWNDSDAERIVLLFEIWRPELDQRERAEVSALLALSGQYAE